MSATAHHTADLEPALHNDVPRGMADAMDVVEVSKAVGDQLRANILRVLAEDSFGVMELCDIFGTAQPAMSHHLKKLSATGLLNKRRESTSVFYQRATPLGTPLLEAIFTALDEDTLSPSIVEGIKRVHSARVSQSQHFFEHKADALSQQTALICAADVYSDAVMTMLKAHPGLDSDTALEIGPGNGTLLTDLAQQFEHVTGLDNSAEMLARTQAELARSQPEKGATANVTLQQGDFTNLSEDNQYEAIVAAMVVHHLPSPADFFSHAADQLRPGGVLVVAELCAHDQAWVRDLCGDVWLGFKPEQLQDWAGQAGFALTQQQFLAQRNGFRVQVSAFAAV